MRYFGFFGVSQREVELARTANQLARSCREQVYQQAAARAAHMNHAEARGYVRVKAAEVLRRAAAAHVQGEASGMAARQRELANLATDIVSQWVLAEIIEIRLHAPPARKVA
jgi:hypothetical protein